MKLTPELLKRIIAEEAAKFGDMESTEDRADDVEEVDADEYADSLEKKIDYVKALKIEESRIRRRLSEIANIKRKISKTL